MFAALGRFTVRFRWLIIAGWIVATVVLVTCLPSLSSVEKSSNSAVPARPARRACRPTQLAGPFHSRPPVEPDLRGRRRPRHRSPRPTTRPSSGPSRPCGRCPGSPPSSTRGCRPTAGPERAMVEVDVPAPRPATRRPPTPWPGCGPTFATSGAPAGLAMHLTGGVASSVDEQTQNGHVQTLTELLSVLFILALLFLTFRALLAPFIALLPSAVALVAAGPVIAESTHLGVQVSDLTPILLIVVLLGAGTDYGLFLIFRLREELRRGKSVARGGRVLPVQGGRVDHLLRPDRHRGPGHRGGRHLRSLPGAGTGPGHRHRRGPAGQPDPAPRPARRAGAQRVLAPDPPVGASQRRDLGAHRRQGGRAGRCSPWSSAWSSSVVWPCPCWPTPQRASTTRPRRPARTRAGARPSWPPTSPRPTTDPTTVRVPPARPRCGTIPQLLATAQQGLVGSGEFCRGHRCPRPRRRCGHAGRTGPGPCQLAALGPAAHLPATPPARVTVSPAAYSAYKASAQFISADGRTIRFRRAAGRAAPTSTGGGRAIPAVRAAVGRWRPIDRSHRRRGRRRRAAGRRRRHAVGQRPDDGSSPS